MVLQCHSFGNSIILSYITSPVEPCASYLYINPVPRAFSAVLAPLNFLHVLSVGRPLFFRCHESFRPSCSKMLLGYPYKGTRNGVMPSKIIWSVYLQFEPVISGSLIRCSWMFMFKTFSPTPSWSHPFWHSPLKGLANSMKPWPCSRHKTQRFCYPVCLCCLILTFQELREVLLQLTGEPHCVQVKQSWGIPVTLAIVAFTICKLLPWWDTFLPHPPGLFIGTTCIWK